MAALGRLASQRRRSSVTQPSLGTATARRHRKSSVDTYSNPSYEDGGAFDGTCGAPAAPAQLRNDGSTASGSAPAAPPQQTGGSAPRDGGGRRAAAQVAHLCCILRTPCPRIAPCTAGTQHRRGALL